MIEAALRKIKHFTKCVNCFGGCTMNSCSRNVINSFSALPCSSFLPFHLCNVYCKATKNPRQQHVKHGKAVMFLYSFTIILTATFPYRCKIKCNK